MAIPLVEHTVEVDDIREIFRQVSPYIIRQWKEVCRKLGIQDLELKQLEENGYYSSPAQLAFKGLCLWYDRVGKSANKEKLVSALKQCGLHRAEEEIDRFELRKLKISSNNTRPPSRQNSASSIRLHSSPPTRQPLATKRKQHVHSREINGHVSRPPTRNGSASSSRRISSSKGRTVLPHKMSDGCELCLKVLVTHIETIKETCGIWREKFKEMVTNFYEAILTNPDYHMTALEHAIDNREISVSRIIPGSLIVHFKVLTLGALEFLNQMYKTRRLLAICQNVFVTENSLKTAGAKHIDIKLDLSADDLDDCRDFFLSRKFKESVHPTDTLPAPSFEAQPCLDGSEENDETSLSEVFNDKWKITMMEGILRVQERHSEFDRATEEFVRTLNIVLPKEKVEVRRLSNLMGIFADLNKSYGVSSGVRVDLLREYLLIVNSIRLKVEDIKAKLSGFVENDNCYSDLDNISIVKCLVDDLDLMLQPETNFEEDLSALNRKLTPSEKPFTGLICFVPLLLAKISTLLYTLSPNMHDPGEISE